MSEAPFSSARPSGVGTGDEQYLKGEKMRRTTVDIVEKRENGVTFFAIKNEELCVRVTNLGCHILSIFAKDRQGVAEDVVLGYENVEDCQWDGSYMGAVVGRVANRIKGASFSLNGKEYLLAKNNGPNHLHGGKVGFDQKLFAYEIIEDGILFSRTSPDGEEGYPGNLELQVRCTLHGATLRLEYLARADADTLCNLTNHLYFNLSGGREKIYDHYLRVDANRFACVDENCCPDGRFMNVEHTPFDFRSYHKIGERIDADHAQLRAAGGYDHSFLLEGESDQIALYDAPSGRMLTISTSLPCAQVYTGNFLAGGCNAKNGKPYENRDGVAIETQFLPDSIHLEKESPVILRKGETYHAVTKYRFTVVAE